MSREHTNDEATAVGDGAADAQATKLDLALTAIELLRADNGLNGLVIRGPHGPAREALLDRLLTRHSTKRLPANTQLDALQGGIDASATMIHGKPVQSHSVLDNADIECFVLSNAECWPTATLQYLKSLLEKKSFPNKIFIALDESSDDDAGFTDYAIAELFALHVSVPELPYARLLSGIQAFDQTNSQKLNNNNNNNNNNKTNSNQTKQNDLNLITVEDQSLKEWIAVSQALGIQSIRAVQHCLTTAKALCRWHQRKELHESDGIMAVQLVLGPRASQLASSENDTDANNNQTDKRAENNELNDAQNETETESDSQPEPQPTEMHESPAQSEPQALDHSIENEDKDEAASQSTDALPETLIASVQATLPSHLLAGLASQQRTKGGEKGRDASRHHEQSNGRPIGVRRAKRYGQAERLNLLATLQKAAPWQRMRQEKNLARNLAKTPETSPTINLVKEQAQNKISSKSREKKLIVHPSDLQVTRFSAPVRNTTVFVVDASGSAAMQRLAEAKGAVELLLNECYVRRDRVALITFRGEQANLDLPPTRSLVRAKRALQGLPGGGGTPMASGLQLMASVMSQLQRSGESTVGVVLSDGKANIALDKSKSREQARQDALQQATQLKTLNTRLIFVDTGSRPQAIAKQISQSMGAQYLPLPHGQQHQLVQQIGATNSAVAL